VSYEVLSPGDWARREFGGVNLGDRRLNERAVKVAAAMAADPAGSIPRQSRTWGQAKGAYRLFDHGRVTFESVSEAHWEQTRARCVERPAGHPLVLLVQDTTWLDYSHHPGVGGLGWFGGKAGRPRAGKGLLMHGVLAVAPQVSATGDVLGEVLGLAHNKLWARTGAPKNATEEQRVVRRRAGDRESLRWRDAVKEVGAAPPGVSYLHVGDREGDFFELYQQTRELQGVGFLVRVKHGRNALAGHDTPDTLRLEDRKGSDLKTLMRSLPPLGQKLMWVASKTASKTASETASKATPKATPGRWATVSVSASAVTVYSPQLARTGKALRCWAVRVWEEDAPAGVEPLEWLLLTSLPVHGLDDALKAAGYYGLRWLIEEYHKCLKSGCKVEERQLESAERLGPLIGMLSVVAVRLLQLKNDARVHPDKLASECVPGGLVRTLALLAGQGPGAAATMTVRAFVHAVAKRGGFLGRKSDGEPGYLTLWRGWQELTQVHLGYELARRERDVGNG
jgi:hypothetical protein